MTSAADFRSDTITRPDAAMRAAMAAAVVGDDVFGDDPTMIALEARAAELLGKPASVFCPTGTMANQMAVRVHTRPGDEVLLHEGAHTYRFEQGGLAALNGVQARPLPGPGGMPTLDALAGEIRPDDQHYARTRLIVVENTFNWGGGTVLDQTWVAGVAALAQKRGLVLHLDGARLANAAIATGTTLAALAAPADSVSLCLSKGLGAPVGTMLAGSVEFVRLARRVRKLLGGGMRQVGILAAAGLLALNDGPARLAADHARARRLAAGLRVDGVCTVDEPPTNIVIATLTRVPVEGVLAALKAAGVLAVGFGAGRVRFVTHRDVDDTSVERATTAWRSALASGGAA